MSCIRIITLSPTFYHHSTSFIGHEALVGHAIGQSLILSASSSHLEFYRAVAWASVANGIFSQLTFVPFESCLIKPELSCKLVDLSRQTSSMTIWGFQFAPWHRLWPTRQRSQAWSQLDRNFIYQHWPFEWAVHSWHVGFAIFFSRAICDRIW